MALAFPVKVRGGGLVRKQSCAVAPIMNAIDRAAAADRQLSTEISFDLGRAAPISQTPRDWHMNEMAPATLAERADMAAFLEKGSAASRLARGFRPATLLGSHRSSVRYKGSSSPQILSLIYSQAAQFTPWYQRLGKLAGAPAPNFPQPNPLSYGKTWGFVHRGTYFLHTVLVAEGSTIRGSGGRFSIW